MNLVHEKKATIQRSDPVSVAEEHEFHAHTEVHAVNSLSDLRNPLPRSRTAIKGTVV